MATKNLVFIHNVCGLDMVFKKIKQQKKPSRQLFKLCGHLMMQALQFT